eukprot:5922382-Pyramimonas_sp.AAC.1
MIATLCSRRLWKRVLKLRFLMALFGMLGQCPFSSSSPLHLALRLPLPAPPPSSSPPSFASGARPPRGPGSVVRYLKTTGSKGFRDKVAAALPAKHVPYDPDARPPHDQFNRLSPRAWAQTPSCFFSSTP